MKTVFVTVGTTKFEKLISAVTQTNILNLLHQLGFVNIICQIGNGKCEEIKHDKIKIVYKKFCDDFLEQIKKSDLVISHGGSGTCLEVLRLKKPLIVVINNELMGNHQIELAEKLQKENYLYYCTCQTLENTLKKTFSFNEYPSPDTSLFSKYIDNSMGF